MLVPILQFSFRPTLRRVAWSYGAIGLINIASFLVGMWEPARVALGVAALVLITTVHYSETFVTPFRVWFRARLRTL
jgi:hypothetical protein